MLSGAGSLLSGLGGLSGLIGPVVGGLLGAEGNETSQTSQNKMDPRMDQYVYGANGVLPGMADWYSKNKSGTNDLMKQGQQAQLDQYTASKPGFDQMQSVGRGLLGGSVAGNPFAGGGYQMTPGMDQSGFEAMLKKLNVGY